MTSRVRDSPNCLAVEPCAGRRTHGRSASAGVLAAARAAGHESLGRAQHAHAALDRAAVHAHGRARCAGPRATATSPGSRCSIVRTPGLASSVERRNDTLAQFDELPSAANVREPRRPGRVWLRADCDFLTERATLSYSRIDGKNFEPLGEPFTMVFQLGTFQGVRYSLFAYSRRRHPGRHGGLRFVLGPSAASARADAADSVRAAGAVHRWAPDMELPPTTAYRGTPVAPRARHEARAASRSSIGRRFLSVANDGTACVTAKLPATPRPSSGSKLPTGDVVLMSLATHRFLRIDARAPGASARTVPARCPTAAMACGFNGGRPTEAGWTWAKNRQTTWFAPRADRCA